MTAFLVFFFAVPGALLIALGTTPDHIGAGVFALMLGLASAGAIQSKYFRDWLGNHLF